MVHMPAAKPGMVAPKPVTPTTKKP
jgi:hypothetical protein